MLIQPVNIHPIFVHFPIALLSVYAILEVIRFRKVTAQEYWFYIKGAFVIIGTLSSYLTLYTGDLTKDYFRSQGLSPANSPTFFHLIDIHSDWAVATVSIFTLIAVVYLIQWIHRLPSARTWDANAFWRILVKISNVIISAPIIIPLALIGLVVITITGSLGGSIAFGPDTDPLVHFIYNLLIH